MDMKLKPFDFAQAAARAGLRTDGTPLPANTAAAQGAGFAQAMSQALRDVSALQREQQGLQRGLQLGEADASVEKTMLAMQRAQIGFTAALQVRNRLVQAYSDIMNMQV